MRKELNSCSQTVGYKGHTEIEWCMIHVSFSVIVVITVISKFLKYLNAKLKALAYS